MFCGSPLPQSGTKITSLGFAKTPRPASNLCEICALARPVRTRIVGCAGRGAEACGESAHVGLQTAWDIVRLCIHACMHTVCAWVSKQVDRQKWQKRRKRHASARTHTLMHARVQACVRAHTPSLAMQKSAYAHLSVRLRCARGTSSLGYRPSLQVDCSAIAYRP